jgi:hypothetical protein
MHGSSEIKNSHPESRSTQYCRSERRRSISGHIPPPHFEITATIGALRRARRACPVKAWPITAVAASFTAKYNFGSSEFPQPASSASNYTIVQQSPARWDGTAINGASVYSYRGTVRDMLIGQDATGVPLTSYSVWDQFPPVSLRRPDLFAQPAELRRDGELLIPARGA